jgi:hypothetical protein
MSILKPVKDAGEGAASVRLTLDSGAYSFQAENTAARGYEQLNFLQLKRIFVVVFMGDSSLLYFQSWFFRP